MMTITVKSIFLAGLMLSSVSQAHTQQGVIGAQRGACQELASTWTPSYGSIIGYWKMNGLRASPLASGATVPAAIGVDLATVTSSTQTFSVGRLDEAFSFDKTGALTLGTSNLLKTALPISFSLWLKPSEASTGSDGAGLISTDKWDSTSGSYYGVQLSLRSNAYVNLEYGDGGASSSAHRRSKTSASPLAIGAWTHVVVVVQSATNMQIYLNGIDGTAPGTGYSGTGGALAYSSAASIFGYFSASSGGVQVRYKGLMDEVAAWNVALQPADAMTLYQNQLCP